MSIAIILFAIGLAVPLLVFVFVASFMNRQQTVPVNIQDQIDWLAIQDDVLQSYLPVRKIAAIKRYRELTASGLKEAKMAIDYVVANPEAGKKGKHISQVDTDGAGVKDLLLDGRVDEAVKVYAAFMGVDAFTAQVAIKEMQREIEALSHLSDSDEFDAEHSVAGRDFATTKRNIEEMD